MHKQELIANATKNEWQSPWAQGGGRVITVPPPPPQDPPWVVSFCTWYIETNDGHLDQSEAYDIS